MLLRYGSRVSSTILATFKCKKGIGPQHSSKPLKIAINQQATLNKFGIFGRGV